MKKNKSPHLTEDTLFKMAMAEKVQQNQLFDVQREAIEIKDHLDLLEKKQNNTIVEGQLLKEELEALVNQIDDYSFNNVNRKEIEEAFVQFEKDNYDGTPLTSYDIKKAEEVITNNSWETYYNNLSKYSSKAGINKDEDPFLTMLGQSEYEKLSREINNEFERKTSIKNKTDLKFLAIAIALEVSKGLLFPIVAEQMEYGESFDKGERLDHDDNSIEKAHREARDNYRDKHSEKNGTGKWIEFLYQPPSYDIIRGTGDIPDVNLHGGDHRLYTLGHDPILGWLFGTANIMTDIISIAPGAIDANPKDKLAKVFKMVNMRNYRITRNPMKITHETVSMSEMIRETYQVAREHPMNLPAAIFAEGQHLKSDEFTKKGLPVPVIEVFNPEFASKLYSNNYDALCFLRDVKIIGKSAVLSILIDTIIGLTHGMYYNSEKDGSRDLYEARTRKILLISNTIGTSSNLIATYLSGNLKALDIGGLLITISHLLSDTRFLLSVKKEYIENKLYQKISKEIEELNKIEEELMSYEEKHREIYRE